MRRELSVEIKATPEKVWEMLALDRMPEWMGAWESIAFASDVGTPEGKYRPGVSARVTETWGVAWDLEIVESLKNERIMYRSKGMGGGKVTLTLTYSLKPVNGRTKVTYEASCEGRWFTHGNSSVIEGLIDGNARGTIWKSLDNLKAILERTLADDDVMQFLVAREKVVLCDRVYDRSIDRDKLVLTDRRLFLCGTKGFRRRRSVLKKEINLHNIVRVSGDLGEPSRWGTGRSWLVITPQVGEEWRCEFALDRVRDWNYSKAQSMSLTRLSSWVNAINLELSKSVEGSEQKRQQT